MIYYNTSYTCIFLKLKYHQINKNKMKKTIMNEKNQISKNLFTLFTLLTLLNLRFIKYFLLFAILFIYYNKYNNYL